mmetsp:Transcript_8330/g.18205  ORF Transcript_8330/g.18205 Transcript_8330/m.18205 type:complete len:577 (-) Transcript_8330:23-1753(-)
MRNDAEADTLFLESVSCLRGHESPIGGAIGDHDHDRGRIRPSLGQHGPGRGVGIPPVRCPPRRGDVVDCPLHLVLVPGQLREHLGLTGGRRHSHLHGRGAQREPGQGIPQELLHLAYILRRQRPRHVDQEHNIKLLPAGKIAGRTTGRALPGVALAPLRAVLHLGADPTVFSGSGDVPEAHLMTPTTRPSALAPVRPGGQGTVRLARSDVALLGLRKDGTLHPPAALRRCSDIAVPELDTSTAGLVARVPTGPITDLAMRGALEAVAGALQLHLPALRPIWAGIGDLSTHELRGATAAFLGADTHLGPSDSGTITDVHRVLPFSARCIHSSPLVLRQPPLEPFQVLLALQFQIFPPASDAFQALLPSQLRLNRQPLGGHKLLQLGRDHFAAVVHTRGLPIHGRKARSATPTRLPGVVLQLCGRIVQVPINPTDRIPSHTIPHTRQLFEQILAMLPNHLVGCVRIPLSAASNIVIVPFLPQLGQPHLDVVELRVEPEGHLGTLGYRSVRGGQSTGHHVHPPVVELHVKDAVQHSEVSAVLGVLDQRAEVQHGVPSHVDGLRSICGGKTLRGGFYRGG